MWALISLYERWSISLISLCDLWYLSVISDFFLSSLIALCDRWSFSVAFQDYLMEIQRHPVKSKFCKLRLLCRTLAGNNVYYLTVTAPSGNEDHMRVGPYLIMRVPQTRLTASKSISLAQKIDCGIGTCASQWDAIIVDDERSNGLHNRRFDGSEAFASQIHIQACANA